MLRKRYNASEGPDLAQVGGSRDGNRIFDDTIERGDRVHEGSVKTIKVKFNNSELTADPLSIGFDPTLVIILNGDDFATMCLETTAVRALKSVM